MASILKQIPFFGDYLGIVVDGVHLIGKAALYVLLGGSP